MNTSIQIPSSAVETAPRTAKGEVVKLVQGAPLIAAAAIAVVGIASVAAPFCVWKGEVALFLNESFHTNCSVSTIAEYASAAPGSDWASLLVAALIAAYPAYHAAWRVREGLGLICELRGSGFQQARVAPSRRGERLPAAGDAVHGLWDELAHQRQRDG